MVRDFASFAFGINRGCSCSMLRRVSNTFMNSVLRPSSKSACGNSLNLRVWLQRFEVPGRPVCSVLMPCHPCLNCCWINLSRSSEDIGWEGFCAGKIVAFLHGIRLMGEGLLSLVCLDHFGSFTRSVRRIRHVQLFACTHGTVSEL